MPALIFFKTHFFLTTGKSVSVESAEVMQAPPLAPIRNMIEGKNSQKFSIQCFYTVNTAGLTFENL